MMKPLAPNSLIQNRYLVVHLIGKGGMGEVYLAVDQRLGSAVALKRTFFADDEMLGGAFEREARTLARLRHPVLPKVSDHFIENGEQYLIMEHIAGDDLGKRLEGAQKPFPLSWVLFWADQLLDALAYLHSHEPPIIHRDIKPQNLKLTDENHIVLLDFGLSKNTAGQTRATGSSSGSTGSVVGYTPHYAPMEQIRGTGTNPRSDIYSLSATLYQLMTNTVPADALTRADALLNGSPDPIRPMNELNPEVPREVSDVILHGMEVSQDKRFGDAKSMQKALRKAYSEIQEAMSAQTVIFSAPGEISAKIEQPAGFAYSPEPGPSGADSEATKLKSQPSDPTPATPNFEETVRYDGPIVGAPSLQADIKTEVFSTNDSPIVSEVAPPPTPFDEPVVSPPAENEWQMPVAETNNGGYAADATVANMAFDATAPPTPFEVTESYSAPSEQTAEDPYATRTPSATPQHFEAAPPRVVQPQAKKKSSKAVWVVGILAVLFVCGIVTAGAGWFVYTNYFVAAVTPSPSPEPTLEVTPTPEPTLEAITNSNSSTAQVDTNSNSNIFVQPTPAPTQEVTQREDNPNPRNTSQTEVKKTPVKTNSGAKPTPKPNPPNRPVILQ